VARSNESAMRGLFLVQFGLIARSQALDLGMSSSALGRRLTSGEWVVRLQGVYRLATVPPSWEQDLMAVALWASGRAVASHRSAAAAHELGGIQRRLVELSLPYSRRSPEEGIVLHRSTVMPRCDVAEWNGLPVTSPTRTLVDLGAVVDDEILEAALDDALRRRLTLSCASALEAR
jgi:hypothetical protein